jgi:hypothetical protein
MSRTLVTLSSILFLSACGESSRPSRPTAPAAPGQSQPTGPPYGPTGTLAVSGASFRAVGGTRQPVPGANVEVRVTLGTLDYYFGTFAADGQGRYRVAGLPAGRASFFATTAGHRQPCSNFLNVASDAVLDLELVTPEHPTPATAGPFTVSGIVGEKTPDGTRPASGAELGVERWFDEVIAGTWSDADGRYLLCGLPAGEYVSVFAMRDGRVVSTPFFTVTGNSEIDIELPR